MHIEKKVAEYNATLTTRHNVNLFTEDDITKSILKKLARLLVLTVFRMNFSNMAIFPV